MPTVSAFRGAVIAMFYEDHPPPHFHARHGEHEAAISLGGEVLEGRLPPSVLRRIRSWASLHRGELWRNWNRARTGRRLVRIEALREKEGIP
jgi:hypothetical protein